MKYTLIFEGILGHKFYLMQLYFLCVSLFINPNEIFHTYCT